MNMLTAIQQKWLTHLSNEHKIEIIPYNSNVLTIFQQVKNRIQNELGEGFTIEHHGATHLGISGQGDIDVYIPVPPTAFNSLVKPLTKLFGEPKSMYAFERVRFVTFVDHTMVEVFIINQETSGWIDSLKFEYYLMHHKNYLKRYEKLKESFHNRGGQDYYRAKLEFINEVLAKCKDN